MTVLRSILFNIIFFAWTLVLCVAGLPFLLSRHGTCALARFWIKTSLLLVRCICGIRVVVDGEEYIAAAPAIYASKHQSALDILLLVTNLRYPAFVMKKELLSLPLLGWYLRRAGNVAINRKSGPAALRHMCESALNVLHHGQPLVIFPEGTRTAPGESGRYQRGVAALYQAMNVAVVPVALASGQCWRRNAFTKKPGVVRLRFLPPIPPGLAMDEFMQQLKRAIEPESEKLLHEAQAAAK